MKSLKFLSLCVVALFLSANLGLAQSQASSLSDEQKAELAQSMEEFNKLLQLTEEQKPDFEAITKKYAKQMKAVKEEGGSKYSMYRKVKSIQKNKNAEMKKLLTKDQYEAYLEKQEEMQKKMREKQG